MILRRLASIALLALGLGALASPAVAQQQYQPPGNAKVTIYCKNVTAGDTPCPATSGGGGGAATIADGADVTQGAKADSAYAGSGSASVVSILKGLYTALGTPMVVTPTNSSGAYGSATVGTSASTIITAAACKVFCEVVNNSQTATVCINVGATATISTGVCAAGEITLPPLWHRSWEGSYVPSDAISAIASSGSTPVATGAK